VAVWKLAGQTQHTHAHTHGPHDHHHHHDHDHHHHHAHDHGHHHHEPCDHDHAHCDHEHAHSHDAVHTHDHDPQHAWAPWRYTVLMLPVVLYLLNLPSKPPGEYQELSVRYVADQRAVAVAGLLATAVNPDPFAGLATLPAQGALFTEALKEDS